MTWQEPVSPLPTLGPEIAKHIPGWKFYAHKHQEHNSYSFYLIPEDTAVSSKLEYVWMGMGIYLHADIRANKLRISGHWPHSPTGQTFDPECVWVGGEKLSCEGIGCSLDKEPQKIAADILRRVWVGGEKLSCEGIGCSLDKEPQKIAADILRRFLPKYQEVYPKCLAYMNETVNGQDRQFEVAKELADFVMDTPYEHNKAHVAFYFSDLYGHIDVNHGGDTGTCELRGSITLIKAALEAIKKANGFKK
jgi:hypothetical protein